MHFNAKNIIGQKFFRLTVLADSGKRQDRHILWICECDCGEFAIRQGKDLKAHRASCGCFRYAPECTGKFKHGKSRGAAYSSWSKMMYRCYDKKSKNYKYYGKRNITVCSSWHSFEKFYDDMGDPPNSKQNTIDRINNWLGYEKSNCRWASMQEQALNKRPRLPKDFEEIK